MELSLGQMIKAVRNPGLAKQHLRNRFYLNTLYPLLNINPRVRNRFSGSNIGVVVNWGYHYLDNWPVAVYPFLLKEILKKYDPLIIPSQAEYDRQKHNLDKIIAFEPDGKIAPRINYDTTYSHDVGLITGHPHPKVDWFLDYIRTNDIDIVFSKYYNPFLHFFPDIDRDRLVHFPWSVPERFIIDPESIEYHAQDYVNVFGTYGSKIYSTREDIRDFEFVNTSMRYQTGHTTAKPLGFEEYYLWCRRFDAMVAAGSLEPRYQYTFAKYFEIPAAGALLFAQYCEDLDRLGFDDSNCVIFDSLRDFKEKTEAYLTNSSEYLDIRRSGVRLIRNRHTVSHRVESIGNNLDL